MVFYNFKRALDDSEVVDEIGGADNGQAAPPAPAVANRVNASASTRTANRSSTTRQAASQTRQTKAAPQAAEPEAPEEGQSDDTGEGEAGTIEFTFEDKSIDRGMKKRLHALATEQGFELTDYASDAFLLVDLGEHLGLSGDYADDAKALLEDCENSVAEPEANA
jgi:hypothetical protein